MECHEFNDISPGHFTTRPTYFQGRKGDLELHKNVTLGMLYLRVMVKISRGEKQQEETEKQHHIIVTENYLKVLLQMVFKIMTRSSPANLIVASHGIPHIVEDSWMVDRQRHLPSLSNLLITFNRN